jgi:hypothetical protein
MLHSKESNIGDGPGVKRESSSTNDDAHPEDIDARPPTLQIVGAEKSNIFYNFYDNSARQSSHDRRNSMGVARPKVDLGTWSIHFLGGDLNAPRWEGCRGKLDTGCDENVVKREVVERAGLSDWIQPFQGEPVFLVDASDHEHPLEWVIELTWFRNEETTSRKMQFFVLETGQYDMMFGRNFCEDYLRKIYGDDSIENNFDKLETNGTILVGKSKTVASKGKFVDLVQIMPNAYLFTPEEERKKRDELREEQRKENEKIAEKDRKVKREAGDQQNAAAGAVQNQADEGSGVDALTADSASTVGTGESISSSQTSIFDASIATASSATSLAPTTPVPSSIHESEIRPSTSDITTPKQDSLATAVAPGLGTPNGHLQSF